MSRIFGGVGDGALTTEEVVDPAVTSRVTMEGTSDTGIEGRSAASMEVAGEERNENPLAAGGTEAGGGAIAWSTEKEAPLAVGVSASSSSLSFEGDGIKKLNPDEAAGASCSAGAAVTTVLSVVSDTKKENPLLAAGTGAGACAAEMEFKKENDEAAGAGAAVSVVMVVVFRNPKALEATAEVGATSCSSSPSFFPLISKPPNIFVNFKELTLSVWQQFVARLYKQSSKVQCCHLHAHNNTESKDRVRNATVSTRNHFFCFGLEILTTQTTRRSTPRHNAFETRAAHKTTRKHDTTCKNYEVKISSPEQPPTFCFLLSLRSNVSEYEVMRRSRCDGKT
jgi:hypothetical protein